MPRIDTSKSQATNRTSPCASHKYQQTIGNKSHSLHLFMPRTDTSKSYVTNRSSFHASHRYQQIIGNKSCIFSCLAQIPANHRQQIVHLFMPRTDTSKSQTTNRTSFHTLHRFQQIIGNKSYILSCLAQIPANHRQQIVCLFMPRTDTSKS